MTVRILIPLLIALCSAAPLVSATEYDHLFKASAFTHTDSGDVPYYFDRNRGALAINAAVEGHREKYARASIVFKEKPGSYTITLHAMRETDGECTYRLIVDGELIGTATNGETDTDYEIQLHQFENVKLVSGSKITVESNAVTNGKIPEGEGTAYARGRWAAVSLSLD